MYVLLRLLVNAAALWVATQVVPGISFTGDWALLFGVALVFGALNVAVRPILLILTLPFLLVTLGFFLLVLNAVMLLLTSAVSDALGLGFHRHVIVFFLQHEPFALVERTAKRRRC